MNITWLNYQQEWLTDIFTGADVSDVQNSVLRVMPLGGSSFSISDQRRVLTISQILLLTDTKAQPVMDTD